jgi:hypothetical protein
MDEGAEFRALNVNPNLDFIQSNLNFLQTDDFINPYTEATISSNFYDNDNFLNKYKNSSLPIVFILNVQSLLSKHFKLKTFILDLISKNANIKVICLQEYGKSHSLTLSQFLVSLLHLSSGAKIEGVVLDFLSKVT